MDPFIGEIRLFGGNFAPRGWALCDGSLLAISTNAALFSILGVQFGGNGQTTFALPDLRSRVAVGQGQGPGLSPWTVGEPGGAENVTLNTQQMPSHSHFVNADNSPGTVVEPTSGNLAQAAPQVRGDIYPFTYTTGVPAGPVQLNPTTIVPNGGNQGHPNIQPSLGLTYMIALEGIFPSRQ